MLVAEIVDSLCDGGSTYPDLCTELPEYNSEDVMAAVRWLVKASWCAIDDDVISLTFYRMDAVQRARDAGTVGGRSAMEAVIRIAMMEDS
jgi:hypothetical protein